MAKVYKVWVDIEEYDEEAETSECIDAPFASVAAYETEAEAQALACFLQGAGEAVAGKFGSLENAGCDKCGTFDRVAGSKLCGPCSSDEITCKFCQEAAPAKTAHRHQGGYVGECCWDERLKASE